MFGWNAHRRLSTINTQWSVVLQAARGHDPQAALAQMKLLSNYLGVIERYLRGAIKDEHAAEELSQEFVLRLIRGDFGGVDPTKWRFRDYLKTVLFHMVAQRQRERSETQLSLEELTEPADTTVANDDDSFDASWRAELISLAWRSLEEYEQRKRKPYFTVLQRSMPDHDVPADELASLLTTRFGKQYTTSYVRKIRERARKKFAELLREHVQQSLDRPTTADVDLELKTLGLWSYLQ